MDSSEIESSEILKVLGNKYNPEILSATQEPKSAQELSDELGMPIATSYRRIEELTEVGLLQLENEVLSDEGRRTKVYKSKVEEVRVVFSGHDGDPEIQMEERTRAKDQLADLWDDLKKGQ